ncbi:hypothetical protein E2C01_018033 [Portunus trituberculatus]|uniref:Uncharacterized protein n=1 Tax=Portunus trituberculatus TaxID=210409 RepID=A0A5B7DU10_PORTR|nr:hypothetical protein [Portunus trituberculatus]
MVQQPQPSSLTVPQPRSSTAPQFRSHTATESLSHKVTHPCSHAVPHPISLSPSGSVHHIPHTLSEASRQSFHIGEIFFPSAAKILRETGSDCSQARSQEPGGRTAGTTHEVVGTSTHTQARPRRGSSHPPSLSPSLPPKTPRNS